MTQNQIKKYDYTFFAFTCIFICSLVATHGARVEVHGRKVFALALVPMLEKQGDLKGAYLIQMADPSSDAAVISKSLLMNH